MNKGKKSLTAYISIPIKHEKESLIIEAALNEIGIKVNNPCRIRGVNLPKDKIPLYVFRECIRMIDISDIGILFLDYFGMDCSSELGRMMAQNKDVYGVAVSAPNEEAIARLWPYTSVFKARFGSVQEMKDYLKRLVCE